jgi:DNA mismatch endonuclease, patch repair protein
MAAIRWKNTSPELVVRRALHAAGLRFRLHDGRLPGRPDIVLRRHKAVVFVHGCFWHHHGCRNSVWPSTRAAFWRQKIKGNIARDIRSTRELRTLGWRVFVVWECQSTNPRSLRRLVGGIRGEQEKSAM